MTYQRISLSTGDLVGAPGPLPFAVAGWPAELVADLSALDPAYELTDAGFWPVVDDIPVYDNSTSYVTKSTLVKDVETKTFVQNWDIFYIPITASDVDKERDRRIELGFIFNNTLFQSRLQDQKRISGAGTLALGAMVQGAQPGNYFWHGGAEEFQWIAANDSLVKMDAQTCFAFGATAARHESLHVFHGKALKNMVEIPQDYKDDKYWP